MDEKLEALLRRILGYLHLSCSEAVLASLQQFIKFGVVGISNTLISYLLNVAVLLLLKPYRLSWDYIAGNLVAFFLSVLWSFCWNNKFVFTLEDGKHRSIGKTLLKTYLAYGFTCILMNNLLSFVWIELLHISKYIAPVINLLISVPLNFLINKKWAFNSSP